MLEVCVDSVESAINAASGGASRIELCSALSEGGLTPTLGMLKVLKKTIHIPVFVMIRPRRGSDFCYSELELDSMAEDISAFKEAGADGFVFGCLNEAGEVDPDANRRLLKACGDLPATFHRAFDVTDPEKALETCTLIGSWGFKRILTSGFESSAEKGLENIRRLVEGQTEVGIMAGAGVNASNAREILRKSGCKEIHASARKKKEAGSGRISMGGGKEDLEPLMVCDPELTREIVAIIKNKTISL